MELVVSLFCFSALCWAIVIWGLAKRRKDPAREEEPEDSRRSAKVFSLARERWRRRRGAHQRGKSKSR